MVKVNNKECGKNGVIALDITIDKSEKRDLPARRDSAHHITAKETNNNSDNHHIDNNNNESIDFSEENINTQYSKDTHTEDSSNGEHDEDSSPSLSPEPFSLPLPSFPSPLTTSPFSTPPLSNMPASSSSFLLDSSSSSSTLSASGSPPSDGVEEKQEEEKETDIQPTAGHTLPSFSCSSSSSFCSASLERGGCTNEQMAGGLPLPTPYFSSVSDDKESEKELELKMLKKRLDEVWNLKETHKRAHETAMRLMREMQQKIQELNKTVALAGGNNGGMSYRQPPTSSLSSFSSSCSSSSSSCSSSSSASPRRRVSRITSATDRGHWKANMNQHTKSIIEKCKNTAKVKAGGNSAATNTINNNTYSNGVYTKQQEDSNKNTKSNNNSIHTIDNNNRTHNVNGKNANQSNHNNHSTNPPLPPSKLKNTSVGVEEVPSNEGVVSPLSTRSSSRYTNNTSLNTSSCFSSLSSTVNLSTLFTPRVVTTTHRVPSSCGTTPRNAFIYDNNINTHFPTSPRNLNLNNYKYINTNNNNNNNNNNSTKCMLNHQKCFCCNINSSSSMALCNSVFSPRVGTSNNTNSTNAYKHYNTVPPSSINNAIVQQQQSLEKVFTDMLNQTNSILKHAQMPSYTLEEVESFDLYELCSLRIPNTHLYLDVEYPTENSEGGGLPRLIATDKSSGLFRLHIRKLPHCDDKEMKINTTNNCEKTANLNKKENDSDTSTECNKNQEIHQEESFSLFSFDWLARLFGISTDPYAIEGLPPEAEKMKDTRWDEVAIEYRGTSDKEKLSRNQVTGRFIFNGGSSFGSLMSFPMCAPYAVYCLGSTPKKESIFYVQRDEREQKRKLVLYHKLSQKYMYVDEKTGNVNLGGNRRNEMTNKNADLQENNDTLVANKIDKNDAQCIQKSLSNNTVTSMNIYDKQAKIMSNNCGVNKLKSVNEENDEQTEEMNSSFDCKNSSCSSIEEKETKEVVAQKEKKEEKEQNNDSNCNNNSSSAVSVHGQSNSDNSSFSAFSESAALNQKKTYAALEAEIISLPDMLAHQVANLMLGSLAEQNDMQRYLTAQEECSGNIQEIAEAEEEQGEEKDENVFQKEEVMKNTLTNGKHNNTKNHIQHKTYKAAENGNKKYTKKSSSSEYSHSSAYSSDCTNSSLYSSNEDLCGGDNLDCCENGECNACKNGTEKTGGEKKEKLRNSKKVSDRHKADVLKENSNHGKNSRTKQPISCVVPLLPLTNLRKNSSEDKADTPHDSEWRPKSTLPSCSQKRGGGGEEGGGRGVERKRRGKREEKQEEENKCFRREEEEEYEDCYDEQEEEEEAKVYNIGDDEGECETEGESYEEMYDHLSPDNEIIKDKNDVSSFSTVLEENEGPVSSFSTLEEIEETNEKPQLQNVVAHAAVPNQ